MIGRAGLCTWVTQGDLSECTDYLLWVNLLDPLPEAPTWGSPLTGDQIVSKLLLAKYDCWDHVWGALDHLCTFHPPFLPFLPTYCLQLPSDRFTDLAIEKTDQNTSEPPSVIPKAHT